MSGYDRVLIVDWSGGNDRGAKPKKDAIWAAFDGEEAQYFRNRQVFEVWLSEVLEAERRAGHRILIGFDFPFGFPAGIAAHVTGRADPFALWDWLAVRIEDAPKANNRFDVAADMNALFDGIGPFWGNGLARDIYGLPRKGLARTADVPERRVAEGVAKGAFPLWQLAGAGAVGSQALMGLPVLARLRTRFGADLSIWPFEQNNGHICVIEVWPSLTVKGTPPVGKIKDAWQVETVAMQIARLSQDALCGLLHGDMPDMARAQEGWIFGLGQEALLMTETALRPPPLANDCFALPPGHRWTPMEEALAMLEARLRPVVARETLPLSQALGRVLAADVIAKRSHPPAANAAIDGYGFAHAATGDGDQLLPLHSGRAAAGAPFKGVLPFGQALRVLTGAIIPEGVDTLVLEEDCAINKTHVAFRGPVKRGANTRKAGEDSLAGDVVLHAGQRLRPQDLALAASVGIGDVSTYVPLRLGVLSTGDELAAPGSDAAAHQVYDANRPMLLGLARAWGCEAVDLGHAPDDRAALTEALNQAATRCDMILTSGGASAGEEDHVSALLSDSGSLALWRIALKPGRPLALGVWDGVPMFGLPGNPVAAFVCALLFGYPSACVLSGAGWRAAQGFSVPAAFTKSKREGRREYYRARLNAQGAAEVFASEGSGRVSGLSWATGLVEVSEPAREIAPGDSVRFLPFSSFGI
ncbi:MAG: molybdopterin molybdotransferase [Dinoroseobacter sp.]